MITRYIQKIVFVLLLFVSQLIHAQTYPVQAVPTVTSPYSSKLTDYSNAMVNRINLQLITTDLLVQNRPAMLQLRIQGNGINAQSAPIVSGIPPIYLNGGEILSLTSADLAGYFRFQNLQGITTTRYSEPLPDGVYTICFQVYDMVTKKWLSQNSCATIYLMLNDPPQLNVPSNNEQIASSDFPNIIFSWTPRHMNATNVSYEFELKEILNTNLDPAFAFEVSPLLHKEEGLRTTTLLYDISKPVLIPGKTYAWRVKAISTSGLAENSVFKNNGYSQIYSFKYASNCTAPRYLLSEQQSISRVKIMWQGENAHRKYHVQYRKAHVDNAEWFETYTVNTQTFLQDLEPGFTYEFRVGATCEAEQYGVTPSYIYSGIQTFSIDASENATVFNCGIVPEIEITNQQPLPNLIIDETFMAGDFSVRVLEISGSNGVYSGKGFIEVPYLFFVRIGVEFSNIRINTDYKLIEGMVETTYDPEWGNVDFVDNLWDVNQQSVTVNFPIGSAADISINNGGEIVVTGPDGQTETFPGGKDTVITDSKGKNYYVDANGNVSGPFESAPGGKPTPENTDGVNKNGEVTELTAEGVRVVFEKHTDTQYAFDQVAYNKELTSDYKKVGDAFVPFKAVPNGLTDKLWAKVTLTGTDVVADSIFFKTQNGIKIDAVKEGDHFVLTLKGAQKFALEEVQATIKQGDKYKIAGVFTMVHVSPKTLKLNLVPTTGVTISDAKINEIKAIYKQLAIDVDVNVLSSFDISDYLVGGKIPTEDTFGDLSTYSEAQNAIINAYKVTNNVEQAYYIFVTDKKSSTGQSGYMKLNGQFGFVFDQNALTIAHELAHGAFKLEHPFKKFKNKDVNKGTTQSIMDYPPLANFLFTDWKQINDPAFKLYAFQGQSEGELKDGTVVAGKINGEPIYFDLKNSCNRFFIYGKIGKFGNSEIEKINNLNIDAKGNLLSVTNTDNKVFVISRSIDVENKKIKKYYGGNNLISFKWIDEDIASGNMKDGITKEEVIAPDGTKEFAYNNILYDKNGNPKKTKYVIATFVSLEDCEAGKEVLVKSGNTYVCKTLTENDCLEIANDGEQTENGYREGIEYIKNCGEDAYYIKHQLAIQQADGTNTWGEKIVKYLDYDLVHNSSKLGNSIETINTGNFKYIDAGKDYHNSDVFKNLSIVELNDKLGYLQASTGIQTHIKFIEGACSFTQEEGDKFARDIFTNSKISKAKGIYVLVVKNRTTSSEYQWKTYFAFGSEISPEIQSDTNNKLTINATEKFKTFGSSLISWYKNIPKTQIQYNYTIVKPTQAEIAGYSHTTFLEKEIRLKITKLENQKGNAVQANFYLFDTEETAPDKQLSVIGNIEGKEILELKEQYVESEGKNLALIYADDFGGWQLTYFNPYDTNGAGEVSIRPKIFDCKFTLNKTCQQAFIDTGFIIAGVVAIPFGGTAAIIIDGAAVIYYASTGQEDVAMMYIAGYGIGPILGVTIKSIAQVTPKLVKFTRNLYLETRLAYQLEKGITQQGVETLLNKELKTGVAQEWIIHSSAYSNYFVKATDDEVLIGYIKTESNVDKLVVLSHNKGAHALSNKLNNATEDDLVKLVGVNTAGNLTWLDDLAGILPSGSKAKITSWIDEGLDVVKLKNVFNASADKTTIYNKLNSSKGIYHQRVMIDDYSNIPGVTQGNFVSNAVDNVTSNVVKTINNKQFTMYPGQAKTFVKNASLSIRNSIEVIEDLGNGIQFIKIKPGTKVYRVFDGYKPWDDISMTGNTLPNGSFWTFEKPNLVSDVIEGTAVMPEWNGMTKIIEIEVPSTGLYGWYGKAAKQPASSTTTNFYLKGGEEQIIINFGQNQKSISSITSKITSAPWIK